MTALGAPAVVREGIWRQTLADLRWSLRPPWNWMSGVVANLVLSLLYLIVAPLTEQPHRDWAILVGSYFAVFILADVTTTNVLGADAQRVRLRLLRGTPLRRILVVKNLVLLLVVGAPTVLATTAITLGSEAGYRLVVTIPGVIFPILTWLGIGNLVSVALPVVWVPWRQRWADRRRLRPTLRWLIGLGLPYAVLFLVDPVGRLPRAVLLWLHVPNAGVVAAVLIGCGVLCYGVLTATALLVARRRSVRFDDLR